METKNSSYNLSQRAVDYLEGYYETNIYMPDEHEEGTTFKMAFQNWLNEQTDLDLDYYLEDTEEQFYDKK